MASSGTEFLIEIEQRMKGTSAVTELSKLEDSFASAKDRYKEFQRASEQAAKGLDKVGSQIEAVRAKVAAATASGDAAGLKKAETALTKLVAKENDLKTAAEKAKGALSDQGKTLEALASGLQVAKKQAEGLEARDLTKVGKGLRDLGGPLGELGGMGAKLSKGWTLLSGVLGSTGAAAAIAAAGVVILVAAIAALAVVSVVGVAKTGAWAVGLADTRRELDLTVEALSAGTTGADDLSQALDDTAATTGASTDRMLDNVRALKAAHVAAADIPDALQAISEQEAALGDTSGTAALIASLEAGSTTAGKLASDVDQKFGGTVAKRMLGLGAQAKTLERNLSNIFGGLKIEPLLEGLSRLVGLLDSSSESGKAIKLVFETLFGPLVANADDVAIAIERFILQLEIGILTVAILAKHAGNVLGPMIESVTESKAAADALTLAVAALAVVFGILAVASFIAMIPLLTLMLASGVAIAATVVVFLAVVEVIGAVYDAAKDLKDLDWAQIGNAMVDGLLGPLKDTDKVKKAFTDFANMAKDTVKDVLGIHSPSKVFEELGGYTAEGFADGVDGGAPQASEALDRLASSTPKDGPGGGAGGARVEGNTFNFYGVKDAENAQESFVETLCGLLEGATIQTAATAPA